MTQENIPTVNIIVDGVQKTVPAGISVAAAVLGHVHGHDKEAPTFYHNSMKADNRAPYCLMGVCFECMMEINGEENVQSCLVQVKENMVINRQKKAEAFSIDTQSEDA